MTQTTRDSKQTDGVRRAIGKKAYLTLFARFGSSFCIRIRLRMRVVRNITSQFGTHLPINIAGSLGWRSVCFYSTPPKHHVASFGDDLTRHVIPHLFVLQKSRDA